MGNQFRHIIFLLLTLTMESASGQDFDSANGYYEDANRLFIEQDYDSSIIQLKNALQLSPHHVPTLILSGRIYLKLGRAADAEHTLSEALMLGADPIYATPLLATSLLEQRSYGKLIKDLPLKDVPPAIKSEMLGYHAHALIGLNKLSNASNALKEALAIDPQNYQSRLAEVTLKLRQGNVDKALVSAEYVVSAAPQDTRSWNAYASVLHATGKLEPAIAAYRKAVALEDRNTSARMALIIIYVDLNRDDEAKPHLDFLKDYDPLEPRAAYFRGLIAARSGDRKTEREELSQATQVLAALPAVQINNDPQMLMIGALAHFGLGEFETAREFLEGYTGLNSGDIGAQRLLATVLIALKEENLAIQILASLHRRNPQDIRTATLLATAYDQNGQHARSAELLMRVEGAGQGDLASDRQLAFSLMDAGELDRGASILEKIYEKDKSASGIGLALAVARLREGQLDQAMTLVQSLLRESPSNLSFKNLLGAIQMAAGDVETASSTFQKILEVSPDHQPALLNLAKVLRRQGNWTEAESVISGALEASPENLLLVIEQAELLRAQGNPKDALRLAERAATSEGARLEYNYLLIDLLLQLGKTDEAEQRARQTVANYADSLEAKSILGQTLQNVGKPDKALLVYNRMVKQLGFDTGALYKISVLQTQMGEYGAAKYTLYKALEGNGQHRPSREAYIGTHIALNENTKALELIQQYVNDYPEAAIGYHLQGQAHASLNDHTSAIDSYEHALAISNNTEAILGLYQSQLALGNVRAAEKLVTKRPNQATAGNARLRAAHADLLIAAKRWSEAKPALFALTKEFPKSAPFLNNLAFVLHKMADDSAIEYARKAQALAPFDAMTNDTLGWILVKDGDAAGGIEYLREATARAAGNPELHYHLGVALHKLGRNEEAKIELRKALRSTNPYDGRTHAAKLLAKLDE